MENGNDYRWGYPYGTGDGGGAYQFERVTWDYYAPRAGVPADSYGSATPAQQDRVAEVTYGLAGAQPWAGDGC